MTNEEADALDELLTNTTPKLTNVPGVFAKRNNLLEALDPLAANYILTISESSHQTPSQVIGNWARERIAAAM
jgi:hypothetical protein